MQAEFTIVFEGSSFKAEQIRLYLEMNEISANLLDENAEGHGAHVWIPGEGTKVVVRRADVPEASRIVGRYVR